MPDGAARLAREDSFPLDTERRARAAWSMVVEPGDAAASAVIRALGAGRALAWARWSVGREPAEAVRALRSAVREGGAAKESSTVRESSVVREGGASGPQGGDPAAQPDARSPGPTDDQEEVSAWARRPGATRVIGRALSRWEPRLMHADPRRVLDALDAVDGFLLVPGDRGWPRALADLDTLEPLCLWVRGANDLHALTVRSVAIVGARAATGYGERVAGELAGGAATAGVTIVSGGAYGIDVAAHRGALAAGGRTVALLAGGVDRPYPAGNARVLGTIADEGGALVAETPPGTAPVRSRFLLRNRLIAAIAGGSVVVEAAWRSGALSTAARTAALLRPLGAVPGPVTSVASAGCHRLLREGYAVCVTDTAEMLELLGAAGPGCPGAADSARTALGPALATAGAGGSEPGGAPIGPAGGPRTAPARTDRLLDALPLRGPSTVDEVARRAGLGWDEVEATLGLLELRGAVLRVAGGWRLARPTPVAAARAAPT